MKGFFKRKSSEFSGQTGVFVVIFLVSCILVGMVFLGMFGMETISGLRGFVGAEGLWSKSQKRSVIHLVRYADSHDEQEYVAFKNSLSRVAGHNKARLELEKSDPDLDVAHKALIRGGNHPQDVENMAFLFRLFRNFAYIDRAISIWERGDGLIADLEAEAAKLHDYISTNDLPAQGELAIITREIILIDGRLTVLEEQFSIALGEATRWAKSLLSKVLVASAVVAAGICMWLLLFIGKIIAKMQLYSDELIKQREEIYKQSQELTVRNRLATGHSMLDEQMRGDIPLPELCDRIIRFVAKFLDIPLGAIFVNNGEDTLQFMAGYAFSDHKKFAREFAFGQGIIGQAALDHKISEIDEIPDGYLQISSAVGSGKPASLLVVPFVYNDMVVAVMELGSFSSFSVEQKKFVEKVANSIAVSIHTRIALSRTAVEKS